MSIRTRAASAATLLLIACGGFAGCNSARTEQFDITVGDDQAYAVMKARHTNLQ